MWRSKHNIFSFLTFDHALMSLRSTSISAFAALAHSCMVKGQKTRSSTICACGHKLSRQETDPDRTGFLPGQQLASLDRLCPNREVDVQSCTKVSSVHCCQQRQPLLRNKLFKAG